MLGRSESKESMGCFDRLLRAVASVPKQEVDAGHEASFIR